MRVHPVKDEAVKMMRGTEDVAASRGPRVAPLCDQEELPGTPDISHQTLRHFQHLSVTGPHQAVDQIQELCRQWLQPETRTKEQIIDQLVLHQFLSTLPKAVQAWVRWKRPKNSKEAGTLVENFVQAHREEGEEGQDDGDSAWWVRLCAWRLGGAGALSV